MQTSSQHTPIFLTIALTLPPLAWMTFEVGLAVSLQPDCEAVGSWLGPVWGAAALLACILGALAARRVMRAEANEGGPVAPWMAKVSLLGSGVFVLAILFQTLATLIVPSCAQ